MAVVAKKPLSIAFGRVSVLFCRYVSKTVPLRYLKPYFIDSIQIKKSAIPVMITFEV